MRIQEPQSGVPRALALLLTVILLGSSSLRADSVQSECGYSSSPESRPDETSACVFSQRQGYISIRIDGGREFDFSPVGDSPGNYRDTSGQAVYRRSGLGAQGQIFRLGEQYLYVFWNPSRLACQKEQLTLPGHCQLADKDLSFTVAATADSSLNQLRITPAGLSIGNDEIAEEIDGTAYRAELADLDGNGWPEIYVYVSSAGSGSYGSLVAYAVNNGKSLSPIYLPPMEQSPEVLGGYMGHDEFAVVENTLVRRFPIYREGDTNAAAGGGTRQLQYQLEPGEAGWILRLDRVAEH
jgi:hypothetical protein